MVSITVMGKSREYPVGTILKTVAEEFQPEFPCDILLARVNGKLQELHKKVQDRTEVRFLTAKDRPGLMAYQRSVLFMMLKAFYEVVGSEHIHKISVDFSYGDGLFIEASGDFALTEKLVDTVRDKMREYASLEIPIRKRSVSVAEAAEIFHNHGMLEKERVFHYRRSSRVNLYSIGNFENYFYGYMVQNTGYIRYFDLKRYQDGLLLLLPSSDSPEIVAKPAVRPKLFATLRESEDWGRKLNVANVGELNDVIVSGRMNEIILIQEALMEKKLGDIAERIAAEPEKKLVMIAGPSSSGKTTFSHRLSIQLRAVGLTPHPISVDNYFVERENTPKDADGNYNYECLGAIDVELFNRDMQALIAGETVELPTYNFITGLREYKGDTLKLGPEDILVIEGIHCLNEELSYTLPKEKKFKIYISALTQLNIDEHNRISTTDGRLLRRIVRDARVRGSSAQNTIRMWPSVRRGEEENIFPYQEDADIMFNSALVYELSVLKPYVDPLLFAVPADSDEYVEAKRLLKFLDYFLGVSSENIPGNSLMREFIGGGCFKV
ncbi:MAG: nucleoside kinase [Clostridiales bacterium]|nr:nucleoside kinase [Clostridiales bacterium]